MRRLSLLFLLMMQDGKLHGLREAPAHELHGQVAQVAQEPRCTW